tara:strand:+ start:315 stop:530 length:216 start_codon:yes stop_codon:yes gene_type:complete
MKYKSKNEIIKFYKNKKGSAYSYKRYFYNEWIVLINSKFDKIIDDAKNNELNSFIHDFKLLKHKFNKEFSL